MEAPPPAFVDREVIILTRNGIWLADGEEISHEPTRRLFARSLKKDSEGYFLAIGHETKRIRVEDTAYFVNRIDGNTREGYLLWLSDGTSEKLDPSTLKYRPGRLTCLIKNQSEETKFLHAPYFELLKNLEEDTDTYFLNLMGIRVELSKKGG